MKSKAVVLHEPTDEAGFTAGEAIQIETIDIESPVGDQVLVEIGAASLCHTDVSIAFGELDETYPLVMGHEGAGIVREVGEAVTSVKPGDHVVLGRTACGQCKFCRLGRSNICLRRKETQPRGTLRDDSVRFSKDGEPRHHCHSVSSFSEYTLVTEDVAIKITDELPLHQASLLGCGVFTGFGAATNTADVDVGSSVAVFGAGGVGLNAVQGAVLRGATPIIAVDPVPEKLEVALEVGATHTIDPLAGDVVEQIHSLTGDGVDYAFDAVGKSNVAEDVIASVAPLGTAVLVGTPPSGKKDIGIDLHAIVYWEKQIIGSFNGSYDLGTAIPKLARLAVEGKLQLDPLITSTRPLEEVPNAMVDLLNSPQIRQVFRPH